MISMAIPAVPWIMEWTWTYVLLKKPGICNKPRFASHSRLTEGKPLTDARPWDPEPESTEKALQQRCSYLWTAELRETWNVGQHTAQHAGISTSPNWRYPTKIQKHVLVNWHHHTRYLKPSCKLLYFYAQLRMQEGLQNGPQSIWGRKGRNILNNHQKIVACPSSSLNLQTWVSYECISCQALSFSFAGSHLHTSLLQMLIFVYGSQLQHFAYIKIIKKQLAKRMNLQSHYRL